MFGKLPRLVRKIGWRADVARQIAEVAGEADAVGECKALGESASRRYFVTVERFTAQRAAALGLVHECVPADALDATVDGIVAALVANGPAAVKACKRLVQDLAGREITPELRDETARRIADIRASDEGREGIASFLGKRDPAWKAA